MSNIAEEIAERLLQMAARRSVDTCFGWTHPDCQLLQQAANLLRQESDTPAIAATIRALTIASGEEDRVTTAPNELPTPLKEIIQE